MAKFIKIHTTYEGNMYESYVNSDKINLIYVEGGYTKLNVDGLIYVLYSDQTPQEILQMIDEQQTVDAILRCKDGCRTGGNKMKNEDINRLNELYKRFNNDEDYKEYEDLSCQAWSENKKARAERSLLGEVNGDRYILLLPYDRLDFIDGEWKYRHYGFDMEIYKSKGSIIVLCQSLCNRDVKYFVDRMLADKEKAEQEKKND